jgi:hypothetical protein
MCREDRIEKEIVPPAGETRPAVFDSKYYQFSFSAGKKTIIIAYLISSMV